MWTREDDMKPSTREFMRGRFDALAFGAKTAQELFERYLSLPDGTADKEACREKLCTVVREVRRTYANVTGALADALQEDGADVTFQAVGRRRAPRDAVGSA